MVPTERIELSLTVYRTDVLPLNYAGVLIGQVDCKFYFTIWTIYKNCIAIQ